jgi:hypothetical protein
LKGIFGEIIEEEFLGAFVEKERISIFWEARRERLVPVIIVSTGVLRTEVDTSSINVVDDIVESYKIDVIFLLVEV